MSALPLFQSVVPLERQHPIYRRLLENAYEAERLVLLNWSDGFVDRDGKFCHEFQISFESCFWELYIHACLKKLGAVYSSNTEQLFHHVEQPFQHK